MNNVCREDNSYCYFHPREVVIGVCPLCLNERLLLVLASTQGGRRSGARSSTQRGFRGVNDDKASNNKPPISFHKIFDFGSLLHRLEFRPWKSDFHDDHDRDRDAASTSDHEDSFISIKFEENGKASWEMKNDHNHDHNHNTRVSKEDCTNNTNMTWNKNHQSIGIGIGKEQQQLPNNNSETKIVIDHGKPRGSPLRWRKKIGHLFQHMRWKRSSKVEGVKVRKGWIRTLTKNKRTMES